MKIFPHFNTSSNCPICKKNDDKPCTLIPIVSTIEDNIAEAEQIHIDCINLSVQEFNSDRSIKKFLIQEIPKDE